MMLKYMMVKLEKDVDLFQNYYKFVNFQNLKSCFILQIQINV